MTETQTNRPKLSVLDFASIFESERPADAFRRSVEWAKRAEKLGFERIWYSEHHNMKSIASSAPAVLIAHVAAHTEKINLGAGGVMLPNHSPLVVAEQFGTLAELHPGRIDLGLGRAPGTDMTTVRALRRDPRAAEHFPDDVAELASFLSDHSSVPGVTAVPGYGTNVPLYILGSSLFGAQLAAKLGLPYGFASHFAPAALRQAVQVYRDSYQPSEAHPEPYVIAGANVVAADSTADAQEQFREVARQRVKVMAARGRELTDEEVDMVIDSPAGQQIIEMLHYTAVGSKAEVTAYLEAFAQHTQADEIMLSIPNPSTEQSLRSMEIVAEGWGLTPNA